MDSVKRIAGVILSVVAWLFVVLALIGAALYTAFFVMWLHAPPLMVLALVIPIVLAILLVAWGLDKAGRMLRPGAAACAVPRLDT